MIYGKRSAWHLTHCNSLITNRICSTDCSQPILPGLGEASLARTSARQFRAFSGYSTTVRSKKTCPPSSERKAPSTARSNLGACWNLSSISWSRWTSRRSSSVTRPTTLTSWTRRWRKKGVEMIAPHRSNRKPENKTQDGRKLRRYKRRWTVERTIGWLQNYRRLRIRWENSTSIFRGFINLTCALLLMKKASG